jgi:hypothetical protein
MTLMQCWARVLYGLSLVPHVCYCRSQSMEGDSLMLGGYLQPFSSNPLLLGVGTMAAVSPRCGR